MPLKPLKMAKKTIKQHDITDCGAACLASISAHYNLQLPISRIRQYAGTDKKEAIGFCKDWLLDLLTRL